MIPLVQINIKDTPINKKLPNTSYITIFIEKNNSLIDGKNGDKFILREYSIYDELINIEEKVPSSIKVMPLLYNEEIEDFPCYDDLEIDTPNEYIDDNYYNLFINNESLKFFGWPSLIQSEINSNNGDKFIFQIPSIEKSNLIWGDSGIYYFHKNSITGNWEASSQMY